MRRVLLTRSNADNARLAAQLQARGIASHSLPLLDLQPLTETPQQRSLMLDLDRYHAVMVVSPTAARLGLLRLDRYWPQPPIGQHWFAVGAGTAAPLADYGLPVVYPQQGQDSESLLALPIWAELLQQDGLRVMIWRGEGGREHLANQVRAAGGQVDYLELYRRQPGPDLTSGLMAAEAAGVSDILLLSSQALQFWQQAAAERWPHQAGWRCWVPGERVAALARAAGCKDVRVCAGADDAALLAAISTDYMS
ncbi:uroporphyrinogen-III synthase [Halopseudomonas salegens]|uniref:Uroporphyrinogen-III synthase n=1 Tax=Halopseudomonas salegens TaxID=1434072 RepID=A0A1H2E2V0_9GAMM|nr:uroporphyrinogen-III synthase [Halopseudomonas salegens]SDT89393.1 uroporphyrinogen-III synthase [Halopseudomonas salegens]